jgi:hypothetical protein
MKKQAKNSDRGSNTPYEILETDARWVREELVNLMVKAHDEGVELGDVFHIALATVAGVLVVELPEHMDKWCAGHLWRCLRAYRDEAATQPTKQMAEVAA